MSVDQAESYLKEYIEEESNLEKKLLAVIVKLFQLVQVQGEDIRTDLTYDVFDEYPIGTTKYLGEMSFDLVESERVFYDRGSCLVWQVKKGEEHYDFLHAILPRNSKVLIKKMLKKTNFPPKLANKVLSDIYSGSRTNLIWVNL